MVKIGMNWIGENARVDPCQNDKKSNFIRIYQWEFIIDHEISNGIHSGCTYWAHYICIYVFLYIYIYICIQKYIVGEESIKLEWIFRWMKMCRSLLPHTVIYSIYDFQFIHAHLNAWHRNIQCWLNTFNALSCHNSAEKIGLSNER